jgi:hypothetical protein
MHIRRHEHRHVRNHKAIEPANKQSGSIELKQQGWRYMPHINQLDPKGAGKHYDGSKDCAPAVVAMLAHGYGRTGNLKDADLIKELGQGLTDRNGTEPRQVARMLERVGIPVAGKALAGRYDDRDVNEHLRKGHMLIAQVEARGESGKNSSHYVLVRGKAPNGNYIVSDPMAKQPYEVTPAQLRNQIKNAPPSGGMLIPVAGPGGKGQAGAFAGVGDSFEGGGKPLDNRLDIKYGDGAGGRGRGKRGDPITPKRFNVRQFLHRLFQMSENRPAKASHILEDLQTSRAVKDRRVLRHFERSDKRDPSIGKMNTPEAL